MFLIILPATRGCKRMAINCSCVWLCVCVIFIVLWWAWYYFKDWTYGSGSCMSSLTATRTLPSVWSVDGRIYGALFNLMCVLKETTEELTSNWVHPARTNVLRVTDVHDKAELGRTSKGGQRKAKTTTLPYVLSSSAVCSEPSQWSLTGAANIVNKALHNWPLLRILEKKKASLHVLSTQQLCFPKLSGVVSHDVWNK